MPVHVLAGTTDPLMSPTEALGWARHTTAVCRVHVVPGGHFFPRESPDLVHALVTAAARNHRVPATNVGGFRP